jgi:hypothetical protein
MTGRKAQDGADEEEPAGQRRRRRAGGALRRLLTTVGPGFVTGPSDDDPSGIGTYAVAEMLLTL